MATTQKTVYALMVSLADTHDYIKTYNIDNPSTGITMTEVNAAYANVIGTNNNSGRTLLYNSNGYPFDHVAEAKRKTVVTTIEDLPDE